MGKGSKAQAIGRRVHRYVNQRRESHGRSELTGHEKLVSTALSHSRTIAQSGDFSHNAGGSTPQGRCSGFRGVSENIFKTQDNGRPPSSIAGEAVKNWMNSAGHRQNILRKRSSLDGVGVWISGNQVYITHNFAHGRGTIVGITDALSGNSSTGSRAFSWAVNAGSAALTFPYHPLRVIKSDWWQILPRHRQKNLTLGVLLGVIMGWSITPATINSLPGKVIEGGPQSLVYQGVIGMFLLSWAYNRWIS